MARCICLVFELSGGTMRKLSRSSLLLALMGFPSMAPNCVRAQSRIETQAPLTFDVASLKPSAPGGRGGIIRSQPGTQRCRCTIRRTRITRRWPSPAADALPAATRP